MIQKSCSIHEFCVNEGISKSMYHKIVRLGKGPQFMKIGRRTIITADAINEWRKKMEGASLKKEENIIIKKP